MSQIIISMSNASTALKNAAGDPQVPQLHFNCATISQFFILAPVINRSSSLMITSAILVSLWAHPHLIYPHSFGSLFVLPSQVFAVKSTLRS
jgi:hypothetical protein